MTTHHLLLAVPDEWQPGQKGDFFEVFISEILLPMRFKVERRLRFTGMEIDLLAKGLDQPRTVLVECKAHREALPADTISKLLGNVMIRGADAGWLFTTSDLSKDGKGQWEDIQNAPGLVNRFTWYSPEKIIDVLISQGSILDPKQLVTSMRTHSVGDATLICSPSGKRWLVEILEDGLPTYFVVFDGKSGNRLSESEGLLVARASDRFGSLKYLPALPVAVIPSIPPPNKAPVARVVPGDAWDDLRPARPVDFVGRDDEIQGIFQFIGQVSEGSTTTRTFAIQGPSGWGKSSLVLKLGDLAAKGRRVSSCSLTSVDCRSATNSAFVCGAIRSAFLDAIEVGILPNTNKFELQSLTHPLDSADVEEAVNKLSLNGSVIVLIFDQFEELFAKESLFETFNAIRELSLDLDSKQSPLALGFAWKTDISLPQQHPAYHLWHELSDRRREFRIRQFGTGDIGKVVSRAERVTATRLSPALRGRLIEQCQGYPWLLKKLLVHIFKRLETTVSQFVLLERELDVELLFKEDLADLNPEQLRCLQYVAERAPVYVSEVDEHFRQDITNLLLTKRLLVRSGLNYVIYWDIFRDYLTDRRVPQIPWSRNFQRDPKSAIAALQIVAAEPKISAREVAKKLGTTEHSCINLMSDLVALQVVDRVAEDSYSLAGHIKSITSMNVAEHIHGQFARHVVCRELSVYDKETPIPIEELSKIVRKMRPADAQLADKAVHHYAMNLKRWLLFSGHIEERGVFLYRPRVYGSSMGILPMWRSRKTQFLGSGTYDGLLKLISVVIQDRRGVAECELMGLGLRNAIYDALALGIMARSDDRRIYLLTDRLVEEVVIAETKRAILEQDTVRVLADVLSEDANISNAELGERLKNALHVTWKPTSALRYANGIRRYLKWAKM
ncbi:MAG: AAA family ATPase [Smithellaceae bacterium]